MREPDGAGGVSSLVKGLFGAAAASFVAGIGLLIVEDSFFKQPASIAATERREIQIVESASPLGLDGTTQSAIAKLLGDRNSSNKLQDAPEIRIGYFEIINQGNTDISELDAQIYSRVSSEEGDFIAVKIDNGDENFSRFVPVGDGKIVDVPIDLLKPEENLRIWYVMSPFNLAELRIREPNVEILSEFDILERARESSLDKITSSSDGFSSIIFIILFSVAAFAAGAGLMSSFYDTVLRAVGFDPKEVLDAYESQKNKK